FIPTSAKNNVLSGTVNGAFSAPRMLGVYFIAGLGVYKSMCSGCGHVGNPSAAVGFNGGGGFKFGLAGFAAFIEARYHHFTTSTNGTSHTTTFIPISFGFLF